MIFIVGHTVFVQRRKVRIFAGLHAKICLASIGHTWSYDSDSLMAKMISNKVWPNEINYPSFTTISNILEWADASSSVFTSGCHNSVLSHMPFWFHLSFWGSKKCLGIFKDCWIIFEIFLSNMQCPTTLWFWSKNLNWFWICRLIVFTKWK